MQHVIRRYEAYLFNTKKFAVNTVASYLSDIHKYINYLNDNNIELLNAQDTDIISFLEYEKEVLKNSPVTIARSLSTIKCLYEYITSNHVNIKLNSATKIKSPDNTRSTIKLCETMIIRTIIDSIGESNKYDLRDKVIFKLMESGCSLIEILKLNINRYSQTKGTIILGYDNRERTITLNQNTQRILNKYLKESRAFLIKNGSCDYLIVTQRNTCMDRKSVWRRFKMHSKKVGIGDINLIHLRNVCVLNIIESGINIENVKNIVGHTNIASTQRFIRQINKFNENKDNNTNEISRNV